MEFTEQICRLMCQDPGGRGLPSRISTLPAGAVADELFRAQRVLLLTGFPIPCDPPFGPRGETDGPPGTANLAAALQAVGCETCVATDELSLPLVKAALSSRAPEVPSVAIPQQNRLQAIESLLSSFAPTHLVALERPGKARDGHFYNMRGARIDHLVTDTDPMMAIAQAHGIITIGIGDGGNELGMSGVRAQVEQAVANGAQICADLAADYTLVSGVSNWWGWGIAALLSVRCGRMLLPTVEQESAILEAVLLAGAVDGCHKQPLLSVDGIPLSEHLLLLQTLSELTRHAIASLVPSVPALV